MKKFAFLLLLCFGLSMGANAQNADVVTKADCYAYELASATNDVLKENCTVEAYENRCAEIGYKVGFTIIALSDDQNKLFLNVLYACLLSYCEQYGIDPVLGEILVDSIKKEFATINGEKPAQTTESAVEMADRYAQEMATLFKKAFEGAEIDKEIENLGFRLGADLAQMSSDNVKLFRDSFYEALKTYASQIDGLDSATCTILIEFLKGEFDPVFEQFYN